MHIEDTIVNLASIEIPEHFTAEMLKDFYVEYSKIRKNYQSAIREISTKLEILDDDFELLHKHNPIHHMECRVKSADSILEKIQRRGYSLSKENAYTQLTDIAGVRVICYYIEDIYTIAALLKQQTDIQVIKEVDYIKNPKPNGYRSLHLVVTVPVFFVDRMENMPVEIQIRTIAMDFWASLEHQLRYKSKGEIPQFISRELKECSETIASTDLQMQKIHSFLSSIETMQNALKEETDDQKEVDSPEAIVARMKENATGIDSLKLKDEKEYVTELSKAVNHRKISRNEEKTVNSPSPQNMENDEITYIKKTNSEPEIIPQTVHLNYRSSSLK